MQCPSCGSQVSVNTKFCPKCGSPIQNMAPQGGGYNQTPQPQPGQQPGKTKAIASLVLGIVGIVLDFFFVTIFLSAIGCVLGIVGIIMYSGAKKEGFRWVHGARGCWSYCCFPSF